MSENAWCILVMLKPSYLIGALVCAKSLKNTNTQYPIICMITQDIINLEPNAFEILLTVFDDVVIVPIIDQGEVEIRSIRQKEMYSHWMSKSFTKWNCLTLINKNTGALYDQVILLDTDMLMLTNCDELFELQAPAGCFSQPWAYPYQKFGGIPNPYIRCGRDWLHKKNIPHGATIKAPVIINALLKSDIKKPPTFTVGAFMVLLKPNLEDYELLLQSVIPFVRTANNNIGDIYSVSGSDETAIAYLYASRGIDFRHIHQKYAASSWKPEWVAPGEERAYHYFGKTKPWDMDVSEYPDLAIWWDVADLLCAENELIKSIIYPEYTNTKIDIAVAEYNLLKDIQKNIVQLTTYPKCNKKELWRVAILIVNKLIEKTNIKEPTFSSVPYPICTQILSIEYNYLELNEYISAELFPTLITNIKTMITNRIKKKPSAISPITIDIEKNEILCGGVTLAGAEMPSEDALIHMLYEKIML